MSDEAAAQPANAANAPSAAGQAHAGESTNKLDNVQAKHANVAMANSVVYNNTRLVLQFSDSRKLQSAGAQGGRRWLMQGVPGGNSKLNKYGQALHADPSSAIPQEEEQETSTGQEAKKLPETLEDVRTWYRALNDIEKCFVQAVAVLSGAPEHEIRRAANELYRPVQLAEERRQRALLRRATSLNGEGSEGLYVPPSTPPIVLDTPFLARTYTTLRKFDRARRLLWQDTQGNGYSPFSVLVLLVIEQEVPLGGYIGQVGQGLLERLERLPGRLSRDGTRSAPPEGYTGQVGLELAELAELPEHTEKFPGSSGGESSWRVPRALGALWLEADETRLRSLADSWARDMKSDDFWGWRVAHLLEGAFAVEYSQLGQKAYQRGQSVVLSLLADWTSEVHGDATDAVSVRLGCSVAMTYRLLGAQHLPVALKGLEELLQFPLPEDDTDDPISDDVFIAIVSAYAVQAMHGHSREVLKNLAECSERFAHQRRDIRFKNGQKDVRVYRLHRLLMLISALNTFVLLVGGSLGRLQGDAAIPYTPPRMLAARPEISDESAIDTLLTGIIASGETIWREHIRSILCAIFVEDNVELALVIMREWAEEVLKLRGPGAMKVRSSYLDFMVTVIRQAERWCEDLRRGGYNTRNSLWPTLTIIRRWQAESQHPPQPLGAFAEDLLRQLQP